MARSAVAQNVHVEHLHELLSPSVVLSERVDVITNDIQSGTPEVLDKVRAIATNLETSSASLNQLLGSENRDLVSSTLANLDEASASTAALTEELRATREELDQALQQV